MYEAELILHVMQSNPHDNPRCPLLLLCFVSKMFLTGLCFSTQSPLPWRLEHSHGRAWLEKWITEKVIPMLSQIYLLDLYTKAIIQ